eukprot:4385108-Pyramimonas_sp.AAC.1
MPQEEKHAPPEKPSLSVLTWSQKSGELPAIKIPHRMMDKWSGHSTFGKEFEELVEKLEAKYGDMRSKKRGAD